MSTFMISTPTSTACLVKRAVHRSRMGSINVSALERKKVFFGHGGMLGRGGLVLRAAKKDDDQVLEGNRAVQIGGSKLLMKLLDADDTRAAAKEIAPEMDEGFFSVGATYLDMAKKEKQLEVAAKIESALKIAMEEKNKTLRPEIMMFNQLIGEPKSFKRKQILNTTESGEILQMNDGYFFTLLARISMDVENQPDNPQKKPLLAQLRDIKQEALARLPTSQGKGFGK
ncbi:hypothetical protein BSKO_00127 [Bryopsis sp. KO-2023]|nr:hypothetical protein BSKO_00127 [Bryopsis sp. KO-2023]